MGSLGELDFTSPLFSIFSLLQNICFSFIPGVFQMIFFPSLWQVAVISQKQISGGELPMAGGSTLVCLSLTDPFSP